MLGVLGGLYLLEQVDVRVLTRAFGVFVILYACFALATTARPVRVPARYLGPARAILSALAGVAGAAFGAAAGPLYAMHFNSMRMEKNAFRVTITTILGIQALMRIAGYARLGFYDETVAILIVAGLPLMILGTRIGHWLAGRLDQQRFSLGTGVLMLVSGTALLFK
ncbi:Sulfite exporter TauE/SafE [compost metagenome]